MRRRLSAPLLALVLATPLVFSAGMAAAEPTAPPGAATPNAAAGVDPALARSSELTTTTRLADRRSFVIGDRFYEVGAEDGSYPAEGFHTRGEMGGFWSMPIKLLDGVWFNVDGSWLSASSFTSGWGYTRADLGSHSGVAITRTDVAADQLRAGLIGLTFSSPSATHVDLTMDAHSELMGTYPWGGTVPAQTAYNLPDTGSLSGKTLVFREQGTPPVAGATAHDWAAVVGSTLTPKASALGPNFRGPQDPAIICPATGDTPPRCDDTAFGKGTGGQLQYTVDVPAGSRTVWFSVGGSDEGLAQAQSAQAQALTAGGALLNAKVADRTRLAAQTAVTLPGDPQLAQSVAWSKQNLLDARQQANNLQLRVTNAGTKYPAPVGTLPIAQWIGAGWPDYPWIFGTDGEYSAFAAVAAGQFDSIENHLRTLQAVSDTVNNRSGKVVHEVAPDGSVYFGANSDNGNTDETVKFPSAVALVWRWTGDNTFRDQLYDFTVRNLKYVFDNLDVDKDGWPEGAGNVERNGMGPEKLDNSVYAIRGLLDLADMAASKNDLATVQWAQTKAHDLRRRFEAAWWNGSATKSYADSLTNGNAQLFQRYWIGLTPVEAEVPATSTTPAGPVATLPHAATTVAQHEQACFTGPNGLYHTGTGGTSAAKANPGPTCDPAISGAPSDRTIFTLTTSIAAVAEAAIGRMAAGQLSTYTTDIARVQVDPAVYEMPGAMPEISPSPDFVANIDQPFTTRSSGLQSWGTYGVLWPVVHYELGIAPDLGHAAVSVVPQIPDGQPSVAATNVRLGNGSVDVNASRTAHLLTTAAVLHGTGAHLTIGVTLPAGATAGVATLNGNPVSGRTVATARGTQFLVDAGTTSGGVLRVAY